MLTRTETRVLSLLAQGYRYDGVAQEMHYSPETIKWHMKAILPKLGARNRTHAVAIAYRAGLLDLRQA